ncbi:ATP-binding cassette sub-family G member 2 [Oopsacas minuta]|uniref:ATP-binding cassette sub-family G member 2 n=1 Tax=Oopsacas minuta TaxID=111878 RepID=A0AAV7JKM9_9METZ|nr:ATP-binding cassette sub-family G member 2 [Oopsacas minuta]
MDPQKRYLLTDDDLSYEFDRKKVKQVSFQDLSYSVPQRRYVCLSSRPKPVLQSVSGIFRSGLNAILGPTGSGKTSLMDLLAGRISHRRFTGDIRVNGQPQPDHFRFMAGYVVQQDFLEGVLSVRENIHFSASLRLSKRSLSQGESDRQQRARLVEEVIDKLGLSEVADSRIGTDFSRGVSGGERKRTHIATELVIAPSILFLDEPTSGLDAYTALKLMRQLKTLSQEGRLIVVTLHQPRYAILRLLDRVTLLSAGETVYHGEWTDVTGYFSEIGYQCEEKENPGDFFLDLIVRESRFLKNQLKMHEIETEYNERRLATQYISSHNYNELYKQLEDIHRCKTYTSNSRVVRYPTSFIWQFLITLLRSSRVVGRSPLAYLTHTLLASLGYMLFGLILLQSPLTPAGLHDRYGLFTMVILHHLFGLATGTRSIHARKQQFIHEHQQGYYRTLPYVFGQMLPEFFPSKVLSSFVASTILYFMFGFKLSVTSYLLYILSLQLVLYSASSITMFFSALTNNIYLTIIGPEFLFMFMVVIGGNFNYNLIPFPSEALKYFSIVRLGVKTLLINELTDLEFCLPSIRNLTGNGTCLHETYHVYKSISVDSYISGESFLDSQLIMYETAWDLWNGPLGLVIHTMFFFTLTYVALRIAVRKK